MSRQQGDENCDRASGPIGRLRCWVGTKLAGLALRVHPDPVAAILALEKED